FNAIHKERKNWKNSQSFLEDSYPLIGINSQEFQQLLDSQAAKTMLQTMQEAMEYASIQGVPSFIVNGKYMIMAQNIKSLEDLAFKISILLEK
ncbi:MAG: DsbA family protein, partial [Helicobacter sp.]|nr:DsbA family protein [Helicobacter sp.]